MENQLPPPAVSQIDDDVPGWFGWFEGFVIVLSGQHGNQIIVCFQSSPQTQQIPTTTTQHRISTDKSQRWWWIKKLTSKLNPRKFNLNFCPRKSTRKEFINQRPINPLDEKSNNKFNFNVKRRYLICLWPILFPLSSAYWIFMKLVEFFLTFSIYCIQL